MCNLRSTWPSAHSAAPAAAAVSVRRLRAVEYFKDGRQMAGCDLVEQKTACSRNLGKGEVPLQADLKRKLANCLWLLNVSLYTVTLQQPAQFVFACSKNWMCVCVCVWCVMCFTGNTDTLSPFIKLEAKLEPDWNFYRSLLQLSDPNVTNAFKGTIIFSKLFALLNTKRLHMFSFSSGRTSAAPQTFTPLHCWRTFSRKS